MLQDNYTTNYYLPGGSYGQIVSGSYTASDGSKANLISGNYTLTDGTTGNIYGSPSSPSKPNTATLNIPTQYTASGSISVIPVTALGHEITYTTVIPGTTIPPSIVSAATTIPTIANDMTTTLVSTEAASTIPGTTIGPYTSTATTQVAAASATAKGVAYVIEPGATAMTFVVISGYMLGLIFA